MNITVQIDEHYCSDRHNGIEDWVIILIDSTEIKIVTEERAVLDA